MEYYSLITNGSAVRSDADGTRDYDTKQSQSGRERHSPYDVTCIRNMKRDAMRMSAKQPHRQEQPCVTKKEESEGTDWRHGTAGAN